MRKLFLVASFLVAPLVSAQELHTFSNGEVADAEKINENFEDLKDEISRLNELLAQLLPQSKFVTKLDGVHWRHLESSVFVADDQLTVGVTKTASVTNPHIHARTSDPISQGKHYWEITTDCHDNTSVLMFVTKPNAAIMGEPFEDDTGTFIDFYGLTSDGTRHWRHTDNGRILGFFSNGSESTPTGTVFSIAADMDRGELFFRKNGIWLDSDPSTGHNPTFQDIEGSYSAGVMVASNICSTRSARLNFGASDFEYAVPRGYFKGYCPTNDCEIAE